MVRNIERQASLTRALESEYAFPVVLGISLRIGLSLWVALVWGLVDHYFDLENNWSWIKGAYSGIPVQPTLLGRMFTDAWVHWDAAHFLAIARFGYQQLEPGNMNFFPLYPWFVHLLQYFTIGNVKIASLFISTCFAILAFVLFQRLVVRYWGDSQLARWSVTVWALYPTALFFFAPYSEGLYMSLTLGCFLFLKDKKWLAAGLLAGLAGLTRAQGILLVFPIAYYAAKDVFSRPSGVKGIAVPISALILAPMGWLSYMWWRSQHDQSGLFASYSQFSKIRFSDPFSAFVRALSQFFETKDLYLAADLITIIIFGCLLIAMLRQKKFREEWELVLYCVVTLAAFLPWKAELVSPYQSVTRYVLGLFPLYIILADWVRNRSSRGRMLYITASLTLLLICTALYTIWIFVG